MACTGSTAKNIRCSCLGHVRSKFVFHGAVPTPGSRNLVLQVVPLERNRDSLEAWARTILSRKRGDWSQPPCSHFHAGMPSMHRYKVLVWSYRLSTIDLLGTK